MALITPPLPHPDRCNPWHLQAAEMKQLDLQRKGAEKARRKAKQTMDSRCVNRSGHYNAARHRPHAKISRAHAIASRLNVGVADARQHL